MHQDRQYSSGSATSTTESRRRDTPNRLLHSPEEAARILGETVVTPSWLREKFRRREIPGVLIAGKIAFRESDLLAIVQQHEVAPASRAHLPAPPRRRPAAKADGSAVVPLRARRPQQRRPA